MNKSNKKGSNFFQSISNKLNNIEKSYEIDEEQPNINNNSIKLTSENPENIQENENSSKTLKESIISQNDLQSQSPQSLSSINSVYCRYHKKEYLKLEQNTFEIVCQKCLEEGNKSQLDIDTNPISDNFENTYDNEFNCYKHNNIKGSFYCDECQEFVCKMCFADEHRKHKCHLPQVIKKEFIEQLDQFLKSSSELAPVFIENIIDIKRIYENMKKQKDDIEKIPQNVIKIIFNNNEAQVNLMREKIIKKMLDIDTDIKDNFTSYNIIKDKSKKYYESLEKMKNDLNSEENSAFKNNFELCEYHKGKSNLLNEIEKYIKTSLNFINIRLKNSNVKYEDNKESIENSMNMMSKEISNYEKSCISSIITGRQSRSIVLRRYIHFSHNEIKYFKTSIIGFASNNNIFLTGISLCGLYTKKTKKMKSIVLETPNDNNNISNLNNNNIESQSTNDENSKLNIQVTISAMTNHLEGEKLFSQKCELTGIRKIEEPAVIINFEKGINIIKEKLYLIKVENLSDNNYIDIITGRVPELKRKNIQVIRCHNSGIQFLFKQAEGITTDFDEFNQGIIEGVLYSYSK